MHNVTLQQAKVILFEYSQLYLLEVFLLYSLYSWYDKRAFNLLFWIHNHFIVLGFFYFFYSPPPRCKLTWEKLFLPRWNLLCMTLFYHSAPTATIETESCSSPRNTPIRATYAGIPMADAWTDSTQWRTGRGRGGVTLTFGGSQEEKKNGSAWRHLRRDELCRGVSGRGRGRDHSGGIKSSCNNCFNLVPILFHNKDGSSIQPLCLAIGHWDFPDGVKHLSAYGGGGVTGSMVYFLAIEGLVVLSFY